MSHNPFRDISFDYVSSRDYTRDTFFTLHKHFKNKRWLGSNNIYRNKCVSEIKDREDSSTPHNKRHLSQYITFSAPIHCVDGWSYLGRSIYSALLGDSHASRHLAYYAELRAIMSLLASQGIGIFNNIHFYIDSINSIHRVNHTGTSNVFKRGTHDAVYDGFDNWVKNSACITTLGDIIKPEGINLEDWFNHLFVGNPLGFIGQTFLEHLGYDLQHFSSDRDARNEASYRPTQTGVGNRISLEETINLITEIWNDLRPAAPGKIFDLHLLKYSIHKYSKGTGRTGTREYLTDKRILKCLESIGIDDKSRQNNLKNYLKKSNKSSCLIIEQANKRTNYDRDANYHLHMISRAVILLHIASGSIKTLMKDTNTSRGDIQFWWEKFGIDRGLWNDSQPDPLDYMLDDIEEYLSEINDGSFDDIYDLRMKKSLEMIDLSIFERIALNNICL